MNRVFLVKVIYNMHVMLKKYQINSAFAVSVAFSLSLGCI